MYIIVQRNHIAGDSIIVEIDDYQTALEQFEIRKNNLFDSSNEDLYLAEVIKRE